MFIIRSKLEPLALREAAEHISSKSIYQWLERCHNARDNARDISQETIKQLEDDLHVHLLEYSNNTPLLRFIHQSQLALVVNDVFAKPRNTRPFSAAMTEHIMIYEYLLRGAVEPAALALETHIQLSAKRTTQRLKALSIFPMPPLPSWLTRHA